MRRGRPSRSPDRTAPRRSTRPSRSSPAPPGATARRSPPKDVLFTWEVGKHPQSGITNSQMFAKDIVGITAVDDKTFVIHWDKFRCSYDSINDFLLLPEHLERPVFEADPAQYRTRTLYDTDRTNPGLYFGPYRITRVRVRRLCGAGTEPDMVGREAAASSGSWCGRSRTPRRMEANLLSGEVDFVAGEVGLSIEQALAFEKRNGEALQRRLQAGPVLRAYRSEARQPDPGGRAGPPRSADGDRPGGDLAPAVRGQAAGGARAGQSAGPVLLRGLHQVPVRPGRRREAAGRGRLEGASRRHQARRFRAPAQPGVPVHRRQPDAGAGPAGASGAVAEGSASKSASTTSRPACCSARPLRERQFPAMAMFAWLSAPENMPRTIMHSTMIPTPENGLSGQNYVGYSNPEVDKLIDASGSHLQGGRGAAAVAPAAADLRRAAAVPAALFPVRQHIMAALAGGRDGRPATCTRRARCGSSSGAPRPADRARPGDGCCASSPSGCSRRDRPAGHVVPDLRPARADAGRSDRPDDQRQPQLSPRRTSPGSGGLRARPAALERYLQLAGRRASGRFRLFPADVPAGAGGAGPRLLNTCCC